MTLSAEGCRGCSYYGHGKVEGKTEWLKVTPRSSEQKN